jgi:hypothetical protein
MSRNFIKLNFRQRREGEKIVLHLRKERELEPMERNKVNREQLGEYRDKEKMLKEAAGRLKKLINESEVICGCTIETLS